jgi:tetratricopeptide (TPR) repeat protein
VERSTAIRERIQGKDHADLVFDYVARGRILEDLGRDTDAAAAHERALAIATTALSQHHPSLSAILQDLGRLHGKLGQPDLARRELDRALAIAKASEEPGSIAAATSALAEFLHLADQPRDALPLYERALASYETLLGAEHPQLVATLTNLGLAHLDTGAPRAAIPILERAIRLEIARSGERSPQLMLPVSSLGEAQLAVGDRRGARASWQRAIDLEGAAELFPDDVKALRARLARL